MPVKRALKLMGGWSAAIAFLFGTSYCSEMPKYKFEKTVTEAVGQIPGTRLLTSYKSGDLASPVSWFWPATTTWNFAMPDPQLLDRFFTMSFLYDENDNPSVYLVDADCKDHSEIIYDLDEPDNAIPARNIWGEPVVAPNGKTYRRLKSSIKLPPEWLHAFCNTDWTTERKAVGEAVFHPN